MSPNEILSLLDAYSLINKAFASEHNIYIFEFIWQDYEQFF